MFLGTFWSITLERRRVMETQKKPSNSQKAFVHQVFFNLCEKKSKDDGNTFAE